MSTDIIQTNKNWLVWARKSVNYDEETVAQKMNINKEKIRDWERTGKITYSQLIKLSEICQVAPHMFFSKADPVYEKPIVDFRTLENKKIEISPDINFELRNAKNKRETLLDIEDESEDFHVKEFKLKDYSCTSSDDVVNILNNVLEMSNAKRNQRKLNYWISKMEDLGILVFQFYGIPPKDLRGYVLYYDKLPVIGINHRETENGIKFTLFHELAHLLLKKEGLSNFESYNLNNDIEVQCNYIAGEVLVPNKDIDYRVKNGEIKDFTNSNLIKKLANYYKVSGEVIVRKFLMGNYINSKDYEIYKNDLNKYLFPTSKKNSKKSVKKQKEDITVEEKEKRKKETNRRIAQKTITENGDYYISSLIYAYYNDILTLLDIARNLDVSIDIVKSIIQIMDEKWRD